MGHAGGHWAVAASAGLAQGAGSPEEWMAPRGSRRPAPIKASW